MAYLLGLLSWIPLTAAAVLTGRMLAAAHESQTRPADPVRRAASAAHRQEFFDDWSFAWDDLR
jgi:hypothetical protein